MRELDPGLLMPFQFINHIFNIIYNLHLKEFIIELFHFVDNSLQILYELAVNAFWIVLLQYCMLFKM